MTYYPSKRASVECLPAWHTELAKAQENRFKVSGTDDPVDGPMQASMALDRKVSLGVYTLARMLASESASFSHRKYEPCGDVPEPAAASPEEKVALVQTILNKLRPRGLSPDLIEAFNLICPQGKFGAYRVVSNFASTKNDPYNDDILAVEIAAHYPDTTRGANHFASPRCTQNWIDTWADHGWTWVGPIPGVSSRIQQFLVEDGYEKGSPLFITQLAAQRAAANERYYIPPERVCGTATRSGNVPLKELPKQEIKKRASYGFLVMALIVGGTLIYHAFSRRK